MNKEEMVKEAYTLMVKNNPDEAIKNLIRLDKELDKKNKIIFKALHLLRHNDIYDYRVFEEMLENILRGEDNDNKTT